MHFLTLGTRELYHGTACLTQRKLNWLRTLFADTRRARRDRKHTGESRKLNLLTEGIPTYLRFRSFNYFVNTG